MNSTAFVSGFYHLVPKELLEPGLLNKHVDHIHELCDTLGYTARHIGIPLNCSIKVPEDFLGREDGSIFNYICLEKGQTIEDIIPENYTSKIIHVCPKSDVIYEDFRDTLWDLHLEGYEIWFHLTDGIKQFINQPKYFNKLAHRGVKVGVSGKTTGLFHSWNPKKHIPQLISELNIHFFNRVEVDFPSDSCNAETQMHQSILDSLDIKS